MAAMPIHSASPVRTICVRCCHSRRLYMRILYDWPAIRTVLPVLMVRLPSRCLRRVMQLPQLAGLRLWTR